MDPTPPDASLVRDLLRRYARVRLDVATDRLAERNQAALRKLIEAARWIDRIYWEQRSADGWRLKKFVARSPDSDSRRLERLIDLNFWPWDTFDDDRPFWGHRPRPPGGNLYPADLTRAEMERYLADHPAQREALLSHTTVVRRDGERLVAVPYALVYKDALARVAEGVVEAAELTTHAGFADFLRQRARDLVAGTHSE